MKTLRQLIEGATPGPWREQGIYVGADEATVCDTLCSGIMPLEAARNNRQLIARCNPATMALVLKALELTAELSPEMNSTRDAIVAAMTALENLNGQPAKNE